MAVVEGTFADHEAAHPNAFRLEIPRDSVFIRSFKRNTIITYKRVGYAENLSGIGRVCEAFGIADHGVGEDHLPVTGPVPAERPSAEFHSVLQLQGCTDSFVHGKFVLLKKDHSIVDETV